MPVISRSPDSCIAHKNRPHVLSVAFTFGASMEMGRRPGFGAYVGAFGEDLGTMSELVWAGMRMCEREI